MLDKYVLPDRIQLVQSLSTKVTEDNLECTVRMARVQLDDDEAVGVEILENTMCFDKPILL